jgi:hypothetical protein
MLILLRIYELSIRDILIGRCTPPPLTKQQSLSSGCWKDLTEEKVLDDLFNKRSETNALALETPVKMARRKSF